MDMALAAGLFVTAFLAATILPFSSEAAVAGAVAAHPVSWLLLIAVASAGNILGSVLNWWMGRAVANSSAPAWARVDPARLRRAEGWYRRWGRWSLLLSWVPVMGDPITIVAGLMREPLRVFLPLVAAAKIGRYLLVAWATISLA
jgi:membrane protein YqaA with SNARE-associated domain